MASSLRIGAAWWKQDKNGNHYLSVAISSPVALTLLPDQRLSLFANQAKEHDNQPDFDVVVLPERDRGQDDFSPEQAPRSFGATDAPRAPQRYAAPEDVPPPPRQAPMAPRAAAPAPRQPAPPPQQRAAPAARPVPGRTRQPAPPPDYDEELSDPFAE